MTIGRSGPERKIRFGRSLPDKEAYADRGLPPAFTNTESHWWDSGQVYGKDEERQEALRTHREGKLKVAANGRLELDGGGPRADRRQRQLVDRPFDPPHALHTRAQRDLRPAARRLSGAAERRRVALSEGAARQHRGDRQDPHGGMDAGASEQPDHALRHARQLVGRVRRDLLPRARARDAGRDVPGDSRLRSPITTPRPIR